MFASLSTPVKQYLLVTGNYWAFTLTDGALRMLVVLHFHQLSFDALSIAMLFLFYEFFGVITNLLGGWLGARIGLNKTMNMGLSMQVIALLMLTVPSDMLTIAWVMMAQALSGIAKDLNKMSAKSSIKTLVSSDQQDSLFKWVALLTGSKNALKGIGFFIGALLLTAFGFTSAIWIMASGLIVMTIMSLIFLKGELGQSSFKPKFRDIFSKSANLNYLSAARLALFGARDIWFVVALPVYFSQQLNWQHWQVGTFMASWVIVYGIVQAIAPKLTGVNKEKSSTTSKLANSQNSQSVVLKASQQAKLWGIILTSITLVLWLAFSFISDSDVIADISPEWVIVVGLIAFGIAFAINSSLHSYLVVSLARSDGVSLDVGFYYMANAMGRLIGTVLSGWLYVWGGLGVCLIGSVLMLAIASFVVARLRLEPKTALSK